MELTKPHYPADETALARQSPAERIRFEQWMQELDAAHQRIGSPYGEGSLWQITGAECWLTSFEEGDTAADALAEDLSNADME